MSYESFLRWIKFRFASIQCEQAATGAKTPVAAGSRTIAKLVRHVSLVSRLVAGHQGRGHINRRVLVQQLHRAVAHENVEPAGMERKWLTRAFGAVGRGIASTAVRFGRVVISVGAIEIL